MKPFAVAVAVIVAVALFAFACTIGVATDSTDDRSAERAPASSSDAESLTPSPEPSRSREPTPAPTPTPMPTATSVPTSTPVPTATATPEPIDDGTPVVVESPDGWVITQGEIDKMKTFIEEIHRLEFTAHVEVIVSDDIGAEIPEFEIFNEREWDLLQALGLDNDQDRDAANQVRRDRIRGVCCRFEPFTSVRVEVEPTKLGTEVIIVHELTHALHTQHEELFQNRRFRTDESPPPFFGATEGVPQFVAFAYLDLAPEELQAEVIPELPIIRDDMLNLIAPGPARFLNFAYATGPAFVDAVVEANGLDALSALISDPPRTTEQILFPDKYLAGEQAVSVADPELPPQVASRSRGTMGAAMLMFLLAPTEGEVRARQLVSAWAGDRYVVYEGDAGLCLVAHLAMDAAGSSALIGNALVESLQPNFPDTEAIVTPELITLTTCRS